MTSFEQQIVCCALRRDSIDSQHVDIGCRCLLTEMFVIFLMMLLNMWFYLSRAQKDLLKLSQQSLKIPNTSSFFLGKKEI